MVIPSTSAGATILRRPSQSSVAIKAKSWKSMAMYHTPADNESKPSRLCSKAA
jgi:hypothetical protein